MANHLSADATNDFLDLTVASRNFGIIDRTIFFERMFVLSMIGDPTDAATAYAHGVVRRNEWPSPEDEWGHMSDHGTEEKEEGDAFESRWHHDEDGYVYFMKNAGELRNWFFRPGDPDFFPSIPHGHWENRDFPKLDAYLGWLYNGSKQDGRLKRKSIIALWNDQRFRDVAASAIDYYLTNHPHYNGWRVLNPRRLPRMRDI